MGDDFCPSVKTVACGRFLLVARLVNSPGGGIVLNADWLEVYRFE